MTLEERIEIAQNSLAAATTDEQRYLLGLGIQKLKDLIADQKKSVEPSGNQGQLEEMERIKRAVLNPSNGIPALNETLEKKASDAKKEFESTRYEQRVIAKIENPSPITVPVVEMDFKDRNGNTYTRALDQADILSILKTYFKRVAISPKMEAKRYSEAYGSDMGKMVYKLFKGWNTIYNETKEGAAWPPLEDVFPGLGRASQIQKVNAEILWRWASNDK